jgi:epoxyqueuosine reductase
LKNEIPDHFKNKMEDWMFGCDICQDVCPWNRFALLISKADLNPMKP